MQEVQKIGNAFNLHKIFSGRQLNAASRKSLKIQASSIAKRRILSKQRFVQLKVFNYCNTLWK